MKGGSAFPEFNGKRSGMKERMIMPSQEAVIGLTRHEATPYAKGARIMPAQPGQPEMPPKAPVRGPRPPEAGVVSGVPREHAPKEERPAENGQPKSAEQLRAPDKAPGQPGPEPQPEKRRGIKGLMDRLKERKKKRKEEKKERSRQQVFRQYLKPVMDEAAAHFPGMHIEPQVLLGTGVMNKAYHTAFEKSGLALEGQFMAALYRKDPLVSQLYTNQVLTELQGRTIAEKARELDALMAKEPRRQEGDVAGGHAPQEPGRHSPEAQESMQQRYLEELGKAGVNLADMRMGENGRFPQEIVERMQKFEEEYPEMRTLRESIMANRAQSEDVKQAAGAEFTVVNQVLLPQGMRANHLIQTGGVTNPNILALINVYNAEVANGVADLASIASTRERVRSILESDPTVQAEAERVIIALSQEHDAVRMATEQVQEQEQEAARRAHEQQKDEYERRDPRHVLGMVTDDNGNLLTRQRILADRRMRNKLFNDLYRLTDSRPQDFWQQAWDPLSQGIRELEFFNLVQGMSSSPNEQVEHMFAETGYGELNDYIHRHADVFTQRFGRQIDQTSEYQTLANDQERMVVIESVKRELRESFTNYQKERQIRENLHNINAFLYRTAIKPDELFGYIQQFSGELADITNGVQGVTEMMDIYEDELRLAMLRHDGYLRPEDVIGTTKKETIIETDSNGNQVEVDVQVQVKPPITEERSKARLQEMYKKDLIFVRTDDGRMMSMRQSLGAEELAPWELDRIMTLARGNMIANQRLLSLASASRHPVGMTTRFGSYFLQDIIQAYSPNIHLNTKYWVPGYKTSSFIMWGEDREKWSLLGGKLQIRKPWSVKREYHRFHEWKEHTIQYTRDHEQIDANRQNPNRAGDAFTRIYAWKVGSHPGESNESITRDFLENGFDRMIERHVGHFSAQANPEFMNLLAQANIVFNPAQPDGSARIFRSHLPGVHYIDLDKFGKPADGHGHGHSEPSLEDIAATNLYIFREGPGAFDPDRNPGSIAEVKRIREGLNEYAHWIGTGIQLELLHSPLDDYEVKLRKGNAEKKQGVVEAREKGLKIVERMVELQPDKLFLVSRKIQDRVLNGFSGHAGLKELWQQDAAVNGVHSADKFQELVLRTTNDLKMLETDLLNRRDDLLDQGYSFYGDGVMSNGRKVELDMGRLAQLIDREHPVQQQGETQAAFAARVAQFQTDKQDRIRRVEEFRQLIRADYEAHKSPASPSQRTRAQRGHPDEPHRPYTSYEEEFVTHKDFYHGFVLWTGDAPMEEFKMAAVGPTGAFARAAGNNITGMKISESMTKLMSGIKNAHTPEEAAALISPIYSNLSQIDLDMANARVTQVADNVLKWYSADWRSSIPFAKWWFRYMGTASYAQKMYGKRMPVWYAHEKRHFVDLLKEQGYITADEHMDLVDRHSAKKTTEIPYHVIQTAGELITIFLAYYLIKKALEKE